MEIFFVRHGQTDGNVARRNQHPDTELNEVGKEQVKIVATKIALLLPTHLITSSQVRALETAREISRTTSLVPETHAAFVELIRPEMFVGERIYGRKMVWYMVAWFFGRDYASMHDGESYAAFLARLTKARAILMALPNDARVVVVSHSLFINFFLEHMHHPARMSVVRAIFRFFTILGTKNTEIIKVTLDADRERARPGSGWRRVRYHG